MSKGVEKDVATDNTKLKKQLHHHQPGLELFVNCLLRLNDCVFLQNWNVTYDHGKWKLICHRKKFHKQFSIAGQKHPSCAVACDILASFEWNSFHFFTQPGGNCCPVSSEAVGLRDVKGCFKLFKLIMLWTLQCASLSSTMIFCIHVTVTVMVIVIVIVIMMISIIINNNGNLCWANYCRVAWENTWYQSCLDIIAKLMEWENP